MLRMVVAISFGTQASALPPPPPSPLPPQNVVRIYEQSIPESLLDAVLVDATGPMRSKKGTNWLPMNAGPPCPPPHATMDTNADAAPNCIPPPRFATERAIHRLRDIAFGSAKQFADSGVVGAEWWYQVQREGAPTFALCVERSAHAATMRQKSYVLKGPSSRSRKYSRGRSPHAISLMTTWVRVGSAEVG